jgi:hypothetical protein
MSGRLTLLLCAIVAMACGKSTHEPPADLCSSLNLAELGACLAEDEGRICKVNEATLKCTSEEWNVLAPSNGLLITADMLSTAQGGAPNLVHGCPTESVILDAFPYCALSCCPGDRVVVHFQVSDQVVSEIDVVSFAFSCSGYRDPSTWIDPFLACLASSPTQMRIACDPPVADLELELVELNECMTP